MFGGVRPELEKCYHFTQLAVELNEPERGVAPTDSRLRPDQRLLEEGKAAESDRVKLQLEQKQRTVRAEREKAAETLGSSESYSDFHVFITPEHAPRTSSYGVQGLN